DAADVADAVGFGQVAAEAFFDEALGEFVVVVAAGGDGAHVGIDFAEAAEAFLAAHAADDGEVEDDDVVGAVDVVVASVELDGLLAVAGGVVGVFQAGDHAAGEFADLGVVIHEQDAAGAEAQGGRGAGFGLHGFFGLGQEDGEGGAFADAGVHAELSAVAADDGEHGGEAEAGAVFLGGEEGGEDVFGDVGRDAGAVVGDLDLHVVAGGQRGDVAVAEADVDGAQPDEAGVGLGDGLDGVDDEVLENLHDLAALNAQGADGLGGFEGDGHGAAGGGHAHGVLQQVEGGDGLVNGVAAAFGEGEQLAGEGLGGEAGGLGVVEVVELAVFLRGGDAAEDGGEE